MESGSRWFRRWNPLRGEWVVYAAHRNNRPWQGARPEKTSSAPEYDSGCYLCPGNHRISGTRNADYEGVFVFDNDHPVLGPLAPEAGAENFPHPGYESGSAFGVSRVICFHPSHNVQLSDLDPSSVSDVFRTFRQQTAEMLARPDISSILIFENRGEAVGVSNPHPHGQLYAADFPLHHVSRQQEHSALYQQKHGLTLFEAIIANEKSDGRRILYEDDYVIAFIPWFARYAFETMIFPKSHAQDLTRLDDLQIQSLATAFRSVTRRMSKLHDGDFPYVLTIMQAPVDGTIHPEYRMHLWLQPPYRQPGLMKYLAGPEIGAGNFMADTIPEEKASELRRIEAD